eukprot:PhM_4_TR13952/c0_g1_i1/m.101314
MMNTVTSPVLSEKHSPFVKAKSIHESSMAGRCTFPRMSLAIVDYGHMARNAAAVDEPAASWETLNSFTEKIHALTDDARGTIHGLFGDVVQLSWNTTMRVVQHETRAATFLSRVREATGCIGAMRVGKGAFQFCGNVKVRVPVVHASWYEDVPALLRSFAVECNFSVCDEATAANVQHVLRTCRVGVLSMNSNNNKNAISSTRVHAIVSERNNNNNNPSRHHRSLSVFSNANNNNNTNINNMSLFGAGGESDEWMYELSVAQSNDVEQRFCDILTTAVELRLNGEIEAARHTLTQCEVPPLHPSLFEIVNFLVTN